MKKITLVVIALSVMSAVRAQNEISIDTAKSYVKWTGANLFEFNEHFGTVKFKKGIIKTTKEIVSGGYFVIDMNSIANTDGKYNEMLVDHLKGPDFFEVEKFPEAKLEIIKVYATNGASFEMQANLTIKGLTEKLEFRSTFETIGNQNVLHSKLKIDRTRWNITYESKGVLGSVKDGIISDAIELEVKVFYEQ